MDKFWRKDRPADRYIEHVVTEEGEVLKDVDEPLRAHRDHGSAKPELKAERLRAKGKMIDQEPKVRLSQWLWFVAALAAMMIIAYVATGLPR